MTYPRFTNDEIALFVTRAGRVAQWRDWRRNDGAANDGARDVIEVAVAAAKPVRFRVTKGEAGNFLASGLDGWGLTVCDTFPELLDVLEAMTGGVGRAA